MWSNHKRDKKETLSLKKDRHYKAKIKNLEDLKSTNGSKT